MIKTKGKYVGVSCHQALPDVCDDVKVNTAVVLLRKKKTYLHIKTPLKTLKCQHT